MEGRMRIVSGAALVLVAVLAGFGWFVSTSAQSVQAPYFEVDPLWPKPLPNHWLIGSTIGVTVDSRDHVWIIHRPGSLVDNELALTTGKGTCCAAAPPVLGFDQAGTLVGHWGGPGKGYDWPAQNHGIWADDKGNFWLGGSGQEDSHILKFSREGKFLLQVGKPHVRRSGENHEGFTWAANSGDPDAFGRVAKVFYDAPTNEAYVADGYLNRRIAVIDADTGKMKRFWGAYGTKPDDTGIGDYDPKAPAARSFRNPVHCAMVSTDRFVYVCDRVNDRLQVFRTDGTFVTEKTLAGDTRGSGSVWDLAFSHDTQQTFIYIADGTNEKIHILRRETLEELTTIGDGGRQPGQFFGIHNIATDSRGNIYTTETYEGKRVQRFVYKGLRAVTRKDQGTVWPTR
jgi:DNA-binding beta-propeller fold protein YncE